MEKQLGSYKQKWKGKKKTVLLEYANLAAGVRNMRDEARLLTVREPTEGTRECIRQISIEGFFVSIAEWGPK